MKRILIINKAPYGHLIDAMKWCEYLVPNYDVTYLGLGNKCEVLPPKNIKVYNVSCRDSRIIKAIKFLLTCFWHCLWFKGIIFIVYFDHCSILKKILPFRKMHLDIRTLSVNTDERIRKNSDGRIFHACKLFDSVSGISQGVLDRLPGDGKRTLLLPLGSEVISSTPKQFTDMRLLYVGTFDGRNIDMTIEGLNTFVSDYPQANIHYDIIGFSYQQEDLRLQKMVERYNLQDFITFHGKVPHHQLYPFFDKCNIGVSFVPITSYYNIQPPTKTYEYALSGIFTIATATTENKKLITINNGILISATSDDFYNALCYVHKNKANFNEKAIRDSLKKSLWKTIVDSQLLPFLDSLY